MNRGIKVADGSIDELRRLGFEPIYDESVAQYLLRLGTDGIVTDRVDLFTPDTTA